MFFPQTLPNLINSIIINVKPEKQAISCILKCFSYFRHYSIDLFFTALKDYSSLEDFQDGQVAFLHYNNFHANLENIILVALWVLLISL